MGIHCTASPRRHSRRFYILSSVYVAICLALLTSSMATSGNISVTLFWSTVVCVFPTIPTWWLGGAFIVRSVEALAGGQQWGVTLTYFLLFSLTAGANALLWRELLGFFDMRRGLDSAEGRRSHNPVAASIE